LIRVTQFLVDSLALALETQPFTTFDQYLLKILSFQIFWISNSTLENLYTTHKTCAYQTTYRDRKRKSKKKVSCHHHHQRSGCDYKYRLWHVIYLAYTF
jgi:hypothetical protein